MTPNILIFEDNAFPLENKWMSHVSPEFYYECPLSKQSLNFSSEIILDLVSCSNFRWK